MHEGDVSFLIGHILFASVVSPWYSVWLVMAHTFLQVDAWGRCIFSCWTPFACFYIVAFVNFCLVGRLLAFFLGLGVVAGLDFALLRGWCICFQEQVDMLLVLIALFCSMMCFIAFSWHIISGVPFVRGVPSYCGLIALSSWQGRCFTQLRFVWYLC